MPLPLRRPVNRASRGDQVAPRPVTGEDLAGGDSRGGRRTSAVYFAGARAAPRSERFQRAPQLADLNQDRDLVFIDQRGTGGSNGLNCPSPPATLTDRTQVRRSIKSCLDSLRG